MTKLTNGSNKDVIETMQELKALPNMQLGIDEIEFPDGTKEKFYYNGEEDRQAAITFAQICYNATNNTRAAKQMMTTCFALLTKGITPMDTTVLGDGITYYIDYKRKLMCDSYGNILVELEEDEKKIKDKLAIRRLLEERGERQTWLDQGCTNFDCEDDDGEWEI